MGRWCVMTRHMGLYGMGLFVGSLALFVACGGGDEFESKKTDAASGGSGASGGAGGTAATGGSGGGPSGGAGGTDAALGGASGAAGGDAAPDVPVCTVSDGDGVTDCAGYCDDAEPTS